jgi:predicted transposase YbfD/YdcC
LVSVATHSSGIVLAQAAVGGKGNEITAWPKVLKQCTLVGTVTTMDALFTQRDLARYIRRRKGDYLMMVKGNQPQLRDAIALLFDFPPWTRQERDQEYWSCQSQEKKHGRLEMRTTECSSALGDYLHWPGAQQVIRRTCRRRDPHTGQTVQETTYGITSLSHAQASPAQIESLWRGHWTIENRVHYVRDVTMGEDASQAHSGSIPQALAALRNVILALFRYRGWNNIADAIRYYSVSVRRSLQLIGALST